MITFADAAAEILAPWATPAQVREAARALGEDAELDFGALAASKKALLIHQLVHQLRHLAVDEVVEVHRQLQAMLEAEPRGEWRLDLVGGAAPVELRNHLRQVFTAIGMSWERLSRLQAGIGELVRWLRATGQASAVVCIAGKAALVELAAAKGPTAEQIAGSPFVLALEPHVRDLKVSLRGEQVVVAFTV
ncbi:MAG TPA: hypothetical protein VGK67_06640 [Myxococcales bacterium]